VNHASQHIHHRLDSAATLDGTESIAVVQGGDTLESTTAEVAALTLAGGVFTGAIIIGLNSAPADGALAAGQAAIWFDSTNGAAKL